MTRKDMVKAAAPTTQTDAVSPKDLTDLVNRRFNTAFKANHVRPIIWRMANEEGTAKASDGRYWIPPDNGGGMVPEPVSYLRSTGFDPRHLHTPISPVDVEASTNVEPRLPGLADWGGSDPIRR